MLVLVSVESISLLIVELGQHTSAADVLKNFKSAQGCPLVLVFTHLIYASSRASRANSEHIRHTVFLLDDLFPVRVPRFIYEGPSLSLSM